MKPARISIAALVLSLLVATGGLAAPVAVPRLEARVTDLAGVLNPGQRQQLEETLRQFEAAKGSQVVVLVVPSTGEETIEQYGIRVADQWKIGRRGVNDGVILLLAKQDRTVRIEVGRGLEGVIPDAMASRIINEIMVPRFKQGDFPGGIQAGAERILKTIQGEPLPPPAARKGEGFASRIGPLFPILFVGIPMVMVSLSALIGRLLAGLIGGGIMGVGIYAIIGQWVPGVIFGGIFFVFILLAASAKGRSGTGRGCSSSGGWRRGGGGYSGGGGSFSGGGASGRW
jgi:uncharacterized protein